MSRYIRGTFKINPSETLKEKAGIGEKDSYKVIAEKLSSDKLEDSDFEGEKYQVSEYYKIDDLKKEAADVAKYSKKSEEEILETLEKSKVRKLQRLGYSVTNKKGYISGSKNGNFPKVSTKYDTKEEIEQKLQKISFMRKNHGKKVVMDTKQDLIIQMSSVSKFKHMAWVQNIVSHDWKNGVTLKGNLKKITPKDKKPVYQIDNYIKLKKKDGGFYAPGTVSDWNNLVTVLTDSNGRVKTSFGLENEKYVKVETDGLSARLTSVEEKEGKKEYKTDYVENFEYLEDGKVEFELDGKKLTEKVSSANIVTSFNIMPDKNSVLRTEEFDKLLNSKDNKALFVSVKSESNFGLLEDGKVYPKLDSDYTMLMEDDKKSFEKLKEKLKENKDLGHKEEVEEDEVPEMEEDETPDFDQEEEKPSKKAKVPDNEPAF